MPTPLAAGSPRRAARYLGRLALVAVVTVVAFVLLVAVLALSHSILDATATDKGARPLAETADLKVPGWRPATGKAAIDAAEAMRRKLAALPGFGLGAPKTYAAAYLPTRARAAAGARAELVVLWVSRSDSLDEANVMAGIRDGLRFQGNETSAVTRTAAGARMACGSTPSGATCGWALSGAGVILVIEAGTTATAARTDLLAVAKALGGE